MVKDAVWVAPTVQKTGFLEYLIPGDTLVTARRLLNIPVVMSLALIGLIANIINIIVFSAVGLGDPVTVTLCAISIAGVGYTSFLLTFRIFDILDATTGLFPFEPLKNVAYLAIWLHTYFSDMATALTVFIAIQKCACVAIPFIFNHVFTLFRAKLIVYLLYLVTFIIYLPILANPGTDTAHDDINNRTRLGNYFESSNAHALAVFHILFKITLPFVYQVIVIFCTIVLSVKLKQAIRSRQRLVFNEKNSISVGQVTSATASQKKTSTKELQAIQTVTMVSAMFVVCNLPDVLITCTDFVVGETEEDMLKLFSAIKLAMTVADTTANSLVYLKFNSKYRQAFLKTFAQAL